MGEEKQGFRLLSTGLVWVSISFAGPLEPQNFFESNIIMIWKVVKLGQREMLSSQDGKLAPLTLMSTQQKTAGTILPNCSHPQEPAAVTGTVPKRLEFWQVPGGQVPGTSSHVGEREPFLFGSIEIRKGPWPVSRNSDSRVDCPWRGGTGV